MLLYSDIRDFFRDDISMPKPRNSRLETASSRAKLAPRTKPYWLKVSPNIFLGYRKNAGPGSWSVRCTEAGADWIKRIALADDLERADGRAVLTYWQAIDAARKLARRQPGDPTDDEARPITVAEAISKYQADLVARGGDVYNAKRAARHLPASILSKPVGLLGTGDLVRWRDGMIAKKLARDTINRVRTCVRAALSLAARRDRRIANRHVWEEDLEALTNATEARNVILSDAVVGKLITTAYQHDPKLGLFVEVIAQTGARPSQVVRLDIADLDMAKSAAPRLLMPRSGKGHAHKRAKKMVERVPVPVPAALAVKLRQAAAGRAAHARLLTRSDGEPWLYRRSDLYREDFAAVVTAVGLDCSKVTPYALRHSYISRALLRGDSVTLVADRTDTSEREIRRHYAKLISHHADEIARRALLEIEQPPADNVVTLPGRRP
jgi:integrase